MAASRLFLNCPSECHKLVKAPMNKQEMRKRLAALSFSEKVKILEKLRDRSHALAAAGLRRKAGKGKDDGSKERLD